jgi:porin
VALPELALLELALDGVADAAVVESPPTGTFMDGKAGSVQGYNSLPGAKPLDRSELYQLWYRQNLSDNKIIFRIGKLIPTYDFNNVARPVPTQDEALSIPAVTGLLYTPVFVNPTPHTRVGQGPG